MSTDMIQVGVALFPSFYQRNLDVILCIFQMLGPVLRSILVVKGLVLFVIFQGDRFLYLEIKFFFLLECENSCLPVSMCN